MTKLTNAALQRKWRDDEELLDPEVIDEVPTSRVTHEQIVAAAEALYSLETSLCEVDELPPAKAKKPKPKPKGAFPYTIGTERTYIPRKWSEKRAEGSALVVRGLMDLSRVRYHAVHKDDHCVEISSPVLQSRPEFKAWFDAVTRIASHPDLDLHPHHDRMVCGGGHIHVGLKQKTKQLRQFKYNVLRDAINRPYLPWVFSQPDEEGACDNPMAAAESFYFNSWRNSMLAYRRAEDNSTVRDGDKNMSILWRPTTLEFRFFESPLDWSEQVDHLDFVLAYLKWCRKEYRGEKTVDVKAWTFGALNKISMGTAIKDFKNMLITIGLPYARYSKYVERNLMPRWELGRSRR